MSQRAFAILLVAALLLSACGRRGSPEPPGTVEQAPLGASETLLDRAASPGGQEPAEARPAAAPDRPFVLDFLL